jgi:thiol-disulfide isomerase/thioredoxin
LVFIAAPPAFLVFIITFTHSLTMSVRNGFVLLATFLFAAAIVYVATTKLNKKHSLVLTKDTFFEQTKGKTVFIKFYIPGCEGCREFDLVWEQVAAKWADHPQALVGEVDCSLDGESKSWCANDLDLVDYPTLKYGDTNVGGQWLRTYEINRTFPIMYNFTNRTLHEPFCTPGNLGACSPIQKMEMKIQDKFTSTQLDTAIAQQERGIQLHVDEWVRKVEYYEKIEDRYGTNQALRVARINTNLRILKECLAACLDPAWTNFTCPSKAERDEILALEANATDANATNSTNLEIQGGNATDTDTASAANLKGERSSVAHADAVDADTTTLEGEGSSVTDADAVAADTTTEEHSEL